MSGVRELLVRTAESLFEASVSRDVLDRSEDGVWAGDLWAAIEDSGLHEAMLSEDEGGTGLGFADAMSVLRVAGRYAAPVPLAESMLVGWLCSACGRSVPEGPATLFLACRGDDSLRVERSADGWIVSGVVGDVPFARSAATLMGVVRHDDELMLLEVPVSACRVDEDENLAGDARDVVCLEAVEVPSSSGTILPGGIDDRTVRARWTLTRVALMSGALEYLLEASVEYARERIQFGRPIGRFQAVQQELAVLAGEVAAATAAAEAAAAAADEGSGVLEADAAKGRIGEAATRATSIAHQVHGAIGFTHEHDLHTRTRRLWAWSDELGSEGECYARVGRHFCGVGADRLWSALVGPEGAC